MRRVWDRLILALALVRLGQELGTAGEISRAVAAVIDAVLAAISSLPHGLVLPT